jgi:hypothetical protein
MRALPYVTAAAGLLLASCALRAGTPAPPVPPEPPSTWRPYPQLPSVLWHEDFDGDTSLVKYGKVEAVPADADKPPADPRLPLQSRLPLADGKGLLMGEVGIIGTTQRWEKADLGLSNTRLKLPGGHKINDLGLYCVCWAEEAGTLMLVLPTKDGRIEASRPVPTAKTWTAVSFRLSDLGGRGGRLTPDDNLTEMGFMFRPRDATAFRKVYIDNIVVTLGVPKPADVVPLLGAARKRAQEFERTTAKDGFSCTPAHVDALRTAAKAAKQRRKPKCVLVVPPRPEDGAALVKDLTAAATAAKLSGFTFVLAAAPDESPVGGLDDMRTLLPADLDRVQPQFVLLALSYADVRSGARPADSLRIVLDRTLAFGSLPLVSVPPLFADAPERQKLEQTVANINAFCVHKGAPLIEAATVLKGVPGPLDKGELGSAGLTALTAVWVSALKHLDAQLSAR